MLSNLPFRTGTSAVTHDKGKSPAHHFEKRPRRTISCKSWADSGVQQASVSDIVISGAQSATRIRVGNEPYLHVSREAFWTLLQEIVPKDEWKDTAVVLACLESIYRAECQHIAEKASAALAAANQALVPSLDADRSLIAGSTEQQAARGLLTKLKRTKLLKPLVAVGQRLVERNVGTSDDSGSALAVETNDITGSGVSVQGAQATGQHPHSSAGEVSAVGSDGNTATPAATNASRNTPPWPPQDGKASYLESATDDSSPSKMNVHAADGAAPASELHHALNGSGGDGGDGGDGMHTLHALSHELQCSSSSKEWHASPTSSEHAASRASTGMAAGGGAAGGAGAADAAAVLPPAAGLVAVQLLDPEPAQQLKPGPGGALARQQAPSPLPSPRQVQQQKLQEKREREMSELQARQQELLLQQEQENAAWLQQVQLEQQWLRKRQQRLQRWQERHQRRLAADHMQELDAQSKQQNGTSTGGSSGAVAADALSSIDSSYDRDSSGSSTDDASLSAHTGKPAKLLVAERLDHRFLSLVFLLIKRCHFMPFTRRDMEISKSLNADYLSQLFIKGSSRRVDTLFTQEFALRAGCDELSEDASGLLLFKRGYGVEVQQGRLLLPKLDYLQTVLVGNTYKTLRSWTRAAYQQLVAIPTNIRQQAQQPGDSVAQVEQEQGEHEAAAAGVDPQAGPIQQGSAAPMQQQLHHQQHQQQHSVPALEVQQQHAEAGGGGANAAVSTTGGAPMLQRLRRWGLPPKMASAGVKVMMVLSDWGLVPRLDVVPIEVLEQLYPVQEPARLQPLHIVKVALPDVIGSGFLRNGPKHFFKMLFQEVQLLEPTFKEVVVVYRTTGLQNARPGQPSWWGNPQSQPEDMLRQPIQIRVYRDLPVPTWKLVLPDKLLQFRPLDLLRVDLFGLVGLAAVLAQARYDSVVLQLVSVASAAVALSRIVIGFRQMDVRYRSQVNEVLREKLVSTQEGALEFLATSAALQQFEQAALAYILLLSHQRPRDQPHHHRARDDGDGIGVLTSHSSSGNGAGHQNGNGNGNGSSNGSSSSGSGSSTSSSNEHAGLSSQQLCEAAEMLLRSASGVQVRFQAEEALQELRRLGLVRMDTATSTSSSTSSSGSSSSGYGQAAASDTGHDGAGDSAVQPRHQAVDLSAAVDVVQRHWGSLMWSRVDTILREFE